MHKKNQGNGWKELFMISLLHPLLKLGEDAAIQAAQMT
jgi:hypothetical protein